MVSSISELNSLTGEEAQSELLKCCGSTEWAKRLVESRPFADTDDLLRRSKRIWWSLDLGDWLEAFRSHPKIGEKKSEIATAEVAQRWSEQEQAGTSDAQQDALVELTELNNRYYERFGFILIVCATGKTTEEILSLMRDRINNGQDEELRIAAAEQAKITELRIRKLLTS
jgi:OHCU decarboxylase